MALIYNLYTENNNNTIQKIETEKDKEKTPKDQMNP